MPAAPIAPKASARTPERAEELKAKIGALAASTTQIRSLKRTLQKSFFEIGELLTDVQRKKLYEVKGYGSFEAFLEREIDLGKLMGLRITRIAQVFQKEAALAAGLDRAVAAIVALDGEPEQATAAAGAPTGGRPALPLHKQ